MKTKIAALVVAAATAALLFGGWSWHGTPSNGSHTTKIAGWAWDESIAGWAWDDSVDTTSIG